MDQKALTDYLKKHGCYEQKQNPTHSLWVNPKTGQQEVVPNVRYIPNHLVKLIRNNLSIKEQPKFTVYDWLTLNLPKGFSFIKNNSVTIWQIWLAVGTLPIVIYYVGIGYFPEITLDLLVTILALAPLIGIFLFLVFFALMVASGTLWLFLIRANSLEINVAVNAKKSFRKKFYKELFTPLGIIITNAIILSSIVSIIVGFPNAVSILSIIYIFGLIVSLLIFIITNLPIAALIYGHTWGLFFSLFSTLAVSYVLQGIPELQSSPIVRFMLSFLFVSTINGFCIFKAREAFLRTIFTVILILGSFTIVAQQWFLFPSGVMRLLSQGQLEAKLMVEEEGKRIFEAFGSAAVCKDTLDGSSANCQVRILSQLGSNMFVEPFLVLKDDSSSCVKTFPRFEIPRNLVIPSPIQPKAIRPCDESTEQNTSEYSPNDSSPQ